MFGRKREKDEGQDPLNRSEILRTDFTLLVERCRNLDLVLTAKKISEDGEIISKLFLPPVMHLARSCLAAGAHSQWSEQSRRTQSEILDNFRQKLEGYFTGQPSDEFWFLKRTTEKQVAGFLRAFLSYLMTEHAKEALLKYYQLEEYVEHYRILQRDEPGFNLPPLQPYPVREKQKPIVEGQRASIEQIAREFSGLQVDLAMLAERVYRFSGVVLLFIPPDRWDACLQAMRTSSEYRDLWIDHTDEEDEDYEACFVGAGNFVLILEYGFSFYEPAKRAVGYAGENPDYRNELDAELLRTFIFAPDFLNTLTMEIYKLDTRLRVRQKI